MRKGVACAKAMENESYDDLCLSLARESAEEKGEHR